MGTGWGSATMCGHGGNDAVDDGEGVAVEADVAPDAGEDAGVALGAGDDVGESRAAAGGWFGAARPSLLHAKAAPTATSTTTTPTTRTNGHRERRRRRRLGVRDSSSIAPQGSASSRADTPVVAAAEAGSSA